MQGQTIENNIYRLERQFEYRDSITIIRKQVEKYEQLVKERIKKMERVKLNVEDVEKLQKEIKSLKRN
jgi:saccharopine dehydrogenase-like NADP-dependent oxidoreductase